MIEAGIEPRYTRYYCEENVFHLVAARRAAGARSTVAFITNGSRSVALWSQRSSAGDGQPVLWDYHVIALGPGDDGRLLAFDLDSTLGPAVPLPRYAASTFAPPGRLPARHEPRFHLLDDDTFLARFSSDRAHMRDEHGRYREPPPPWPPIVRPGEPAFLAWLDETPAGPGRWLSLAAFLAEHLGA